MRRAKCDELKSMAEWLKGNDGFTLISHVSPDGDTLGSGFALYAILKAMGKTVEIVCDQKVPYIYEFLPFASELKSCDTMLGYKNAVAVDCADAARMGHLENFFCACESTAVVDHHGTNVGFAQHNYVRSDAAATGEMIKALQEELDVTLTKEIATCIFVALVSDTGNFAYSNTTSTTLRIAADLIDTGVDVSDINRRLFRSVPARKMKMLATALGDLEFYADEKIGVVTITKADMAKIGATDEDADGIVEHVRDVETVEIAIFIRQKKNGEFKASLRSKEYADVSKICAQFRGGGHSRAAGCTFYESLELAKQEIIKAAKEALERYGK